MKTDGSKEETANNAAKEIFDLLKKFTLWSDDDLPFLQFTDGGVRVNFGGYHASAGLGGLLGNSKMGGGLHASAGTPFGAHAAAGLGGLLNGNNANGGGGLYARAGLGEGRPEARAGLGGVLDGSGRSDQPLAGGLFAGASTGQSSVGVGKSGGVNLNNNENTAPAASAETPSSKPADRKHTTIQIIPKTKTHKEEREAAKPEISSSNSAFIPPSVVGLEDESKSTDAKADAVTDDDPTHKGRRRFYRKRFRSVPRQKQVIYTVSSIPESHKASPSASAAFEGGVNSRVNFADEPDDTVIAVGTKNRKSGTLFDDIFNIPISTLTAVNQLLRNNAG